MYELSQAIECVGPILFLIPMVLRLYIDDAGSGDAFVFQFEQAGFILIGETGSFDIETQMYGGGDLVDILPAGSGGTDRRHLYLTEWD